VALPDNSISLGTLHRSLHLTSPHRASPQAGLCFQADGQRNPVPDVEGLAQAAGKDAACFAGNEKREFVSECS